ncbi:MAG: RNA polymerase sigma-70 factor [Bacteroidota bacterium]
MSSFWKNKKKNRDSREKEIKIPLSENRYATERENNIQVAIADSQALKLLYDQSGDKLIRISLNLVDDIEVAKGIIQNIFSDLWERRNTLNINTSLDAYVVRAVKYSSIDYLRAQAARERLQEEVKIQTPTVHHDPEEQLDATELKNEIEHLVNLLPPKCQTVFRLSRENYMSNQEIALTLEISEKTVERHMTKALRFLRVGLTDT